MTEPDGSMMRFLPASFQELTREAFAKHTPAPELSAEAYFTSKLQQLQSELTGRKLLYLDTNHWINLRHVVLNYRLEKPGYRQVLSLLRQLHQLRGICCPISFFLFAELMKQTDPHTRRETAKLMDELSGGVCSQFPLEIARSELRQFYLRMVPSQHALELRPWIWTKVGFFAGELLPSIPSLPSDQMSTIQKVWIDVLWELRLEELMEMDLSQKVDLGHVFDQMENYWEGYAAASNQDASFYRSSNLSYERVLEREKALLLRRLLKDESRSIGQEIWDKFPEVHDTSALPPPSKSDYSAWNCPSLQILAGTNAAKMLSQMKFEANDMLDFRHAALAIPYCHAVCCDNPMATTLRNRPCRFGNTYGCELLGRPEEIIDYLQPLVNQFSKT